MQGIYTGVGSGLGGLIGGQIYSRHGGAAVYESAAVFIGIGWIICVVWQAVLWCLARRAHRSTLKT